MSSRAQPQPDPTGYARLVGDGHYADAPSGLRGKHDNVRRSWEDQVTRFALAPALAWIRDRVRSEGRGLRIADLGCGSGEGWDLVLRVPADPTGADGGGRYVLAEPDIAVYHGIDLCPSMVEQARARFAARSSASFAVADLAHPGTALADLPPFDLYYNSYGSLSHLADADLAALLRGVVAHQHGPCVLVIDVHGQYSPEWPLYWGYSRDPAAPRMQPYNMVWMYPEAERQRRLDEQRDYRLRYWRGEELRRFLAGIEGLGGRIRSLDLVDRSVLVGRHMDTRCFNPTARPLRAAVNALLEVNHACPAADLRARHLPASGDPMVDAFFTGYIEAWNALVDWFALIQRGEAPADPATLCQDRGPVPAALAPGLEALAEQARRRGWVRPGDPDANLLQPQFAMLLRQLEFHAQRGLGCGHGLLAVIALEPGRPT